MLNPELKTLTNKIGDEKLRKRVAELLKNPTFEIDGKTYSSMALDLAPASLSRHHCYEGGYVEHVVSTTNLALAMCDSVERIYNGKVNRDLVVAGILLHDLFKTVIYAVNKKNSYSSTNLADYMDHLSIATSELVRRGFPLELVHIVSAHHGDYGPIKPRTIEALICHLADLMDSRLNGEVLNAAAFLTRKATGMELFGLNSKEAFEVVHSKAVEGWAGVARTVRKIRRKRETRKT